MNSNKVSMNEMNRTKSDVVDEKIAISDSFLKSKMNNYSKDVSSFSKQLIRETIDYERQSILRNFDKNNSVFEQTCIKGVIESVNKKPVHFLTIGNSEIDIHCVESLLSALEGLSIDNIDIIVAGDNHLPTLDGSSLAWVSNIEEAGIIYSKSGGYGSNEFHIKKRRKFRNYSKKSFSIYDNESFIKYVPNNESKITVGIDFSEVAPIIGKQWVTYNLYSDDHYKWEIASSKNYFISLDQMYELAEQGFYQFIDEKAMNIANFDKWINKDLLSYQATECARNEIKNIMGCFSLLNTHGNGGIPVGHVICYKPSYELVIRFCKIFKDLSILI